ncbi:unnamed protein product [Hymenolepis diminuta]|uniref:G_PROTEIN_RECEP_F1_2 domain-containing protein n=1 Tax=Hymenolepis diminuta TaxID=6216 RepID=A0A564Z642_HYMDI|nr:unnamed protein product [Hymenolepis diminuta]
MNILLTLVLSLPLKVLYSLPLLQSSPNSQILLTPPCLVLVCLDSNFLALVAVKELLALPTGQLYTITNYCVFFLSLSYLTTLREGILWRLQRY